MRFFLNVPGTSLLDRLIIPVERDDDASGRFLWGGVPGSFQLGSRWFLALVHAVGRSDCRANAEEQGESSQPAAPDRTGPAAVGAFFPGQSVPGGGTRIRVLDDSPGWIVIDKRAGIEAHPSKPGVYFTLWHLLRDLLAYELANGGQVSIVNRLDRETSGITFVAKSREAARHFGGRMERRAVRKEYLAICWGWPAEDRFEVDAPIARQGGFTTTPVWHRQAVHSSGTPALTRFEVLERFEKATPAGNRFALVVARPITGRMHQIRVHLSHLGHPIVGDKLYGPEPGLYLESARAGWSPAVASKLLLPRHALHATYLAFPEDELAWESDLPSDLAEWVPQGPPARSGRPSDRLPFRAP